MRYESAKDHLKRRGVVLEPNYLDQCLRVYRVGEKDRAVNVHVLGDDFSPALQEGLSLVAG